MIVFFDIDGTIIDGRTNQIPESTIRAVEKLAANGHIPIINTGRPYNQVDARVKKMAFRAFVCGCGMEILLDGAWVVHARPSRELMLKCIERSRKYRMHSFYETTDGGILLDGESSTHPIMSREVERLAKVGFTIHQITEPDQPDFVKFVTFPGADSDQDGFVAAMEEEFTVIYRENTMLELVLKGYSKAAGIQTILAHLGAKRADTMAIGDSTNDLPMFSVAEHSVCMGDGMEEVKQACTYITAPVLEDGIEKALVHFGLI